jgi:hypothetical protein
MGPRLTCLVEMLLNDPRINDTIRDEQGRTPLECAATPEIATLIEGKQQNLWSKVRYGPSLISRRL